MKNFKYITPPIGKNNKDCQLTKKEEETLKPIKKIYNIGN